MPDPISAEFLRALAALAPEGASVAARRVTGEQPALWPAEVPATRHMSLGRLREFSAGRAAARDALHGLGAEAGPIPVGAGRAPAWPAGIIGSITHAGAFAAAAAARCTRYSSLGLDAEDDTGLEPGLLRIVCRPDELARLPGSGVATEAKVLFSAKEAVYKCLWPLSETFLEFQEVEIVLAPLQGTFRAIGHGPRAGVTAIRQVRGRYGRTCGMVLSLCWLTTGASGAPDGQLRATRDG